MELIRRPSVSHMSNRTVIEYAMETMQRAGWSVEADMYVDGHGTEKLNLVAAPPGEDVGESDLERVFVCHTDTVPFPSDWKYAVDPLLEDGLIYGRGACDVKGFLACLLAAIEQTDANVRRGVRVMLTADEEVGCIGAKHLLAARRVNAKQVVIGEPTLLHPARAGKGYCLAEVTVFGREAHSAHPQQGSSAIYAAARLILEIERLGDELKGRRNHLFEPGFTTVNVGTVRGGTAKNVIPGECSFLLEWRPIPGEPVEAVPDRVRAICKKLQAEDPEFRYRLDVLRTQPSFETKADAALVRRMEELTGHMSTSIPFGSEANLFSGVADEVVVFGPGDMRTAHSDRECVAIEQLEEAVRCMRSLLAEG